MEKFGTARLPTEDNIIRRMRIARWITKVTDTHSEYVILLTLHSNNGYLKASQCYVYMYLACIARLQNRSSRSIRNVSTVVDSQEKL